MSFLREPTQRDLLDCQPPDDYQALKALSQEARRLGAKMTVHEILPRGKKECCGLCRVCLHCDDCNTAYKGVLGNQGSVPGVKIA